MRIVIRVFVGVFAVGSGQRAFRQPVSGFRAASFWWLPLLEAFYFIDSCPKLAARTKHKYRSSYEKTGKIIRQYATQSGMDTLHYFELVVFSFIIGNADMHLKNFFMLEKTDGEFSISPAYDLISTMLVIKNESEQM